MTRAKVISRNFAVLSTGQIVGKFIAFVVTVRLTRVLETEAFGLLVFALGVLAYASMIVDFGLDSLGAIEAARRRIPVPDLARCILSLRMVLMAVGFVLLALFTWVAPIPPASRAVLMLYGLSLAVDGLRLDWAFIGTERMRPVAAAEIALQVVFALGVFALVHSPPDVLLVPLLYLAGRLVSAAVVGWQFIRQFGSIVGPFDRPLARRLLREALPLMGSSAVSLVLVNFDMVLIGLAQDAQHAGLYGAAYRIVWIPTMLSTAYYTVLRPSLAKSSVEGLHTVETLLQRSVRMTSSLAVASVIVAFMLSRPILEFLYGSTYGGAWVSLRALLCAFALLVVSRNFRNLLICYGRQRIEFAMMASAAVLNVVLNLVLIPRRGIEGAALAALAAEGWILIFGYAAARIAVGPVSLFRVLARPAAAGLLLAGVLYLTAPWHVLLRLAAGGAVYVAGLFALGIVTPGEIRIFLGGWVPSRTEPLAAEGLLEDSGAGRVR